MTSNVPEILNTLKMRQKLEALISSFIRLTGQELISRKGSLVEALWNSNNVIVAHGVESDPRFFFGNQQALRHWEMTWNQFYGMPSRFTAEPELRSQREALLREVQEKGYIASYSGIRISSTGTRFQIHNAIVWNITTQTGARIGQAATFSPVR